MKFILKGKKRSAVSPVIATLLLIAIAVAAAIIVYAFVTGLIGGLSSGAGSSLIPITASLLVPTGTSPGTLAITVQNSANNPITGINVVLGTAAPSGLEDSNGNLCMGETPASNYCNAVAGPVSCPAGAGDPATFCSAAGTPIVTATPLPVGSQVSASVGVKTNGATLQSGSTYSFTVVITFANGSTQTQVVSTTAQL